EMGTMLDLAIIELVGGITGEGNGVFVTGDFHGRLIATGWVENFHVAGNVCHDPACTPGQDPVQQIIGSTEGFGTIYVGGRCGSPQKLRHGLVLSGPRFDNIDVGEFTGDIVDFSNPAWGPAMINGPFRIRGSVNPVEDDAVTDADISLLWLSGARPGLSIDIDGDVNPGMVVVVDELQPLGDPFGGTRVRIGGAIRGSPVAGYVAVDFPQNRTMHGQVTVNALAHTEPAPSGEPWWQPGTHVGVWNEDAQSFYFLPSGYAELPTILGGGSAGEVPFAVHAQASNAHNYADASAPQALGAQPAILWSEWSDQFSCHTENTAVIVEFYGPVRRSTQVLAQAPLLKVEFLSTVQTPGGQTIANTDLTQFCTFTIDNATPAGSRQVRIAPAPGYILPWGTYRVTPWTAADGRTPPLVCADLLTTTEVPVANFTYFFDIGQDCGSDPDCLPDASCPGMLFPAELCDSIDFNNDNIFPDTQDVADFIAVFGGAPCPTAYCNDLDFNNDSIFPDISDIDAFLNVFGGGSCIL
ncbi:MAG TPA: hypothetical protein VHN77_02125, partial [Phycisphaerales bacterium]|nr:hypothetical protein [Phycisphaerales bacterium]